MISETNKLSLDAYTTVSAKFLIWTLVSLPYKQRAFIIYDNDVTLSLT